MITTQVAFLFPGQGSQAVGMGADVFAASPAAKQVFATFDQTLGFALSELCFAGPEETLRSTINAQPAIVAVSLAYLAAFQEALSSSYSSWSIPFTPAYVAGHSVGECSALVAAGAVGLSGVAQLVRERGRLMHEEELACPGGMAAVIGLDEGVLQEICQEVIQGLQASDVRHPGQGQVIIANYNAPGQIVLSGEQQALEAALQIAKERGAKKVIPLAVSGAFHSPVMAPAVAQMAHSLSVTAIQNPQIPLIGNITATPLTSVEELREELAQQVASSVQWTRTIEYLVSQGVTTFFEIGPGKALAGMNKRIAKGATTINISSVAEIEKAVELVREMGLVQ
ncbi:ACP S-malonyltransferase [Tengunoibacter tsumagoiensis]|uniref:Malonyl CoA-acyl carrier protein transacylase n=1 Tax=Tengunoibacter tsumagoiensis TaxID=2014871 RepID=A0A402A4C2_9CHLR|nr:ACP S-malonyltransferase [Tengunoibacter tsumagoiensis]GCE13997.1 malonyl CoA-acyl carrier protein transacylase [Tengunoibacter tsumagoiensis]